ncbi:hypothetical protein L4C34_05825 [Vibrio profundum]|uniref:hypothetical protein n=1 Tax=Vibrio profundum TaxID=2910247 RepID=UPI003D0B1794
MTKRTRNIHGDWTMSYEDQILKSTLIGAFNQEANLSWFNEVKQTVTTSSRSKKYWVALLDAQNWEMSSQGNQETNEEIMNQLMVLGCLGLYMVFSKKVQEFALKEEMQEQSFLQSFFDYDEAYQACLDVLAEAKNR